MAEQSVGFIGVGRMGGPMARRLLQAGIRLTICDTNKAAVDPLVEMGARVAASAAEVASSEEILIASLPTPPVVETVAREIAQGTGTRAKIFIDTSTTGASAAKRVAETLRAKGITAMDAPVSGGVGGAGRGTLAIMVSGPQEALPRIEPVLEHLGKVFFVGTGAGMGQTMKLLNNLLSATAMAISSEAVALGVKSGLNAKQIVEVINAGTGKNSATEDKIPRCVIPRAFNAGFAMGLLNKDVRLCMEEAEALGVPMLVGSAVRQLLTIAAATEGREADMTEMARTVERWAGVTIGGKQ